MTGSTKLMTPGGGGVTIRPASSIASDVVVQVPSAEGTLIYANSSGNVGIGTSSPETKLEVSSSGANVVRSRSTSNNPQFSLFADGYATAQFSIDRSSGVQVYATGAIPMIFSTNAAERMRIDPSGNLLVGTTSNPYTAKVYALPATGQRGLQVTQSGAGDYCIGVNAAANGGTFYYQAYLAGGAQTGQITSNGTTTAYGTTSDYRLKENIQPMQNALGVVAQLNPVTYTWKADGSDGQGFIAHELQAVVPDCVTGEKDAVDAEGNPVYQGIDTSFLAATLCKAIQEQQEQINELKAEIATIKGDTV